MAVSTCIDGCLKMMSDYSREMLEAAHKHSSHHRQELADSKRCGCFYCKSVFDFSAIVDWIDNDNCAICPNCGIDSVLGTASGLPANDQEFLAAMHDVWF